GADPAVYSAWFTDGKGHGDATFTSPPAVTSISLTESRTWYTGHGDFGLTGTNTVSNIPTNQTVSFREQSDPSSGPDTGQFHATIHPPTGYIADPDQIDVPITPDALTTVAVTIKDVTPPVLSLPSTITTPATSPLGATVNFTATANDFIDGPEQVTCTPPT